MLDPTRLMRLPLTVVSRSQQGTDAYGGSTLVESTSQVRGWYALPKTEEQGGVVGQGLTVFLPPDTRIDSLTAVELPHLGRWEVQGSPVPHAHPRGGLTHFTVTVNRTLEGDTA